MCQYSRFSSSLLKRDSPTTHCWAARKTAIACRLGGKRTSVPEIPEIHGQFFRRYRKIDAPGRRPFRVLSSVVATLYDMAASLFFSVSAPSATPVVGPPVPSTTRFGPKLSALSDSHTAWFNGGCQRCGRAHQFTGKRFSLSPSRLLRVTSWSEYLDWQYTASDIHLWWKGDDRDGQEAGKQG